MSPFTPIQSVLLQRRFSKFCKVQFKHFDDFHSRDSTGNLGESFPLDGTTCGKLHEEFHSSMDSNKEGGLNAKEKRAKKRKMTARVIEERSPALGQTVSGAPRGAGWLDF